MDMKLLRLQAAIGLFGVLFLLINFIYPMIFGFDIHIIKVIWEGLLRIPHLIAYPIFLLPAAVIAICYLYSLIKPRVRIVLNTVMFLTGVLLLATALFILRPAAANEWEVYKRIAPFAIFLKSYGDYLNFLYPSIMFLIVSSISFIISSCIHYIVFFVNKQKGTII